MVKVIGADLSLNHGALVELVDGNISDFWYYTDYAGSAGRSKRGFRMPSWAKKKDRQIKQMYRIAWIVDFLEKVFRQSQAEYIGIEDYALDVGHGAHYQGEVGGVARLSCWNRGLKMRLHDPVTVKMFAAHKGNADKFEMEAAVVERWGIDFDFCNQPKAQPSKRVSDPKQNRQTSQDLCDAYALAQIVWTEVQLRKGTLTLAELHEKEVRVFNRVTRSYPIGLLDREWIVDPEREMN